MTSSSRPTSTRSTGQQSRKSKQRLGSQLQSDNTLKWLNRQGFQPAKIWKAEFTMEKIEEYIQGTTNLHVQVVKLNGRNKSCNKGFDHFVMDVCKRVKRCALDKVTNLTDWFTTMIVVANINDVKVPKKLL
jgi:hypothetical protein